MLWVLKRTSKWMSQGHVVQLVTSPTADPGVASSIMARPHTFMEIDHEIISMVILLLPLIQEGLFIHSTLNG